MSASAWPTTCDSSCEDEDEVAAHADSGRRYSKPSSSNLSSRKTAEYSQSRSRSLRVLGVLSLVLSCGFVAGGLVPLLNPGFTASHSSTPWRNGDPQNGHLRGALRVCLVRHAVPACARAQQRFGLSARRLGVNSAHWQRQARGRQRDGEQCSSSDPKVHRIHPFAREQIPERVPAPSWRATKGPDRAPTHFDQGGVTALNRA